MLVAQYRRWGAWNLARLAGSLAISLYGAALISYTLLPLPDPQTLQCRAGSRDPQLTPLRFVGDISAEYAAHGSLRGLLTSFTFLQVAFNVLLFVPWGIILRRHLRRGFLFTVATGFLRLQNGWKNRSSTVSSMRSHRRSRRRVPLGSRNNRRTPLLLPVPSPPRSRSS